MGALMICFAVSVGHWFCPWTTGTLGWGSGEMSEWAFRFPFLCLAVYRIAN